jgi:hypothetical protein
MVTTRTLNLRFRQGAAAPDGSYGSATRTYGEAGWTYGQSVQDPIETRYELTAYPGWGPRTGDWEYRQWDTTPPMEMALLAPGGVPINYAIIDEAELVLTMVGYAGLTGRGAGRYAPKFPLTVAADRLVRTWDPHDLVAVGRYRASVNLTFLSGRTLTVPAHDDASFIVRDGVRP